MQNMIMGHDSERIRKICTHEAGHYVIAKDLSFITKGISVMFDFPPAHSGESTIEPWTPSIITFKELENYLERRIKVLFAGVMAEAMEKVGNYNQEYALNEWKRKGGMSDHAKIRELMQVIRNINHPETKDSSEIQLTSIDEKLFNESLKMVMEKISLINRIAGMIIKKIKQYKVKYELTEIEIDTLYS